MSAPVSHSSLYITRDHMFYVRPHTSHGFVCLICEEPHCEVCKGGYSLPSAAWRGHTLRIYGGKKNNIASVQPDEGMLVCL